MKFYDQKINYIQNNTNENKKIQIKNLKNELNDFIKNPDFNKQDIFKKHPDFIFTNKPMSGDIIREVRREIMNTLNIKIPYESPLFQMLKRGIGIYIENMPEEYNWILQKLLSKKLIAIIISDKTLCLGIDLPIRTTCFLGIDNIEFSKDEYLQMSGRAGRRGHDNQGNIIFYGSMDYLSLINGELPNIIGNDKSINSNYKILKSLNSNIFIDDLFKNFIHKDRKYIDIQYNINNEALCENKKLFWFLRKYNESSKFIEKLYEIETKLFQKIDNDQNLFLFNEIFNFTNIKNKNDIFNIYQFKKINNFNDINSIKKLINILIYIHNNLNHQKYKDICETSKRLFEIFNIILFNYIIFI